MEYVVAPMEGDVGEEAAGPWVCLIYFGPCDTLIICGLYIPMEAE